MLENQKEKLTTHKPRTYYGWYIVAASWMMLFLGGATAVSIYFKPILDEFGWDRATLSLVGAVALLVFAALSPFLGRLIDHFGPRIMLTVCVTAQAISAAVSGVATNIVHLYISRIIGELKTTNSVQVLVNRWFEKKRGLALGIVSLGAPMGTLILAPLSQFLVSSWSWRSTLLFWSGVIAVVLLPLMILVRNSPQEKGLLPDGETAIHDVSGETREAAKGAVSGRTLKSAVGVLSFWLLTATQFICGIGCGLMITHTVIFATDLGYSGMIGASFLSVQAGVNLVGILISGQISDKIARNRVLSMNHVIRGLAFFILMAAILAGGDSLWILYAGMALFGFGLYTTAPLAAGLVADLFGNLRMGTIIGIILSAHMVGMAIGTYGGGITYELTNSYLIIFIIQGGLELAAALCAFLINVRRL
jgi:MFS family permease